MFKLFKNRRKSNQNDGPNMQLFTAKVQSSQLIYTRPPEIFYTQLLEVLIPTFLDKSNPIHIKFDNEFRGIISDLSSLFNDILESGLETSSIAKFYTRLEQTAQQNKEVAFINSQTLLY